MRTSLVSVSALALGLMLGAPAMAQQAGQAGSPAPAVQAQAIPTDRPDLDKIKDKLGSIDVEDREEFKGKIVQALSPEGHPTLMVIGPEDMEGDESIDVSRDELRGKLAEQGFRDVRFVDDAKMVRGKLADDKRVIAFTGDFVTLSSAADADRPDLDRFKERLGDVGLEDRDEFKGKLVLARVDGQPLFMLVGPEDFSGDESIELTAEDLGKFQREGFEDARIVGNLKMVRGKLDDDKAVVSLAGSGLAGEPVATGAIGTRQ